MVKKEEQPAASQAPTTTVAPEPKPEVKTEVKPAEEPKPAGVPSVVPPTKPGESLAVGEQYNAAVANLMEMGFPKDQVEKAMKAAFNNPERATDYLINVSLFINPRASLNYLLKCPCPCPELPHQG